ncbi:MAG: STAS/SEC14 domain-containing protein [Gammaproteobacteria bacterium]
MVSYELIRNKGILVIMPEGPLRTEDFQALGKAVDDYIVSEGALTGVMISAERFPGWEDFAGFLSHLRFIKENNRDIDKVAAVTDSAFLSIMPRVVDYFISADVRHFAYGERDAAMAWLSSGLAAS